jgi:hypothetical protein
MIQYAAANRIDPPSDIQKHSDYWMPRLRGA